MVCHERSPYRDCDEWAEPIDIRDNPGGFYLTVACKAGCICFAIAVLLNALGLISDPFAWMARTFPFMVGR